MHGNKETVINYGRTRKGAKTAKVWFTVGETSRPISMGGYVLDIGEQPGQRRADLGGTTGP